MTIGAVCSLTLATISLGVSPPKPLKVVTTTSDLASLVQAVGGNRVSVSALIVGARDLHRIEAKPSFMSRVSGADLFVAVGLDLEVGYEGPILEGSRNPRVRVGATGHAYAAQWCQVLDRPAGTVTRAQGDIHPYGNPHVWLDPYNARLIVAGLADKLGELSPGDATYFRENAQRFQARLDQLMFGDKLVRRFGAAKLWEWSRDGRLWDSLRRAGATADLGGWGAKMARLAGTPIITYHRSWRYFTYRFGLRVVAELEPKPGLDPTPGHIAEVIRIGQREGVKVLIQEPFYPTRDANFVAARIGARVLVLPNSVGQVREASGYLELMQYIVDQLAGALGN